MPFELDERIDMILHIDMDAFYASIEQLDNPDLMGRCVIVGGMTPRGVVSAASYEARKFGIHSAMPIFQARKKCPEGVFLYPRMERYKSISKKIMMILKNFSPLVEPVSIDEAYLDVTGCERLYGNPAEMAALIKQKIKQEVNLTCSVGGAPYKFLAKIASDLNKPDGLYIISPEKANRFIELLPIQQVPGVGRKTFLQLDQMGIKTLGQIKNYPDNILFRHFGKFGKRLKDLACGIETSGVKTSSERSSISCETTLVEDTNDRNFLKKQLLIQSEDIGRQLRRIGVKAKTVIIKIKHSDFKLITRSRTANRPTHATGTIYNESVTLLNAYKNMEKIRLIGVGASGFVRQNTPFQKSLFENNDAVDSNWDKIDRVMDDINEKYGRQALIRGGAPSKRNKE